MTQKLTGYSAARHELSLRIESLDARIERGEGSIQNLRAELDRCEAGLLDEIDLRDGYMRILELTQNEEAEL